MVRRVQAAMVIVSLLVSVVSGVLPTAALAGADAAPPGAWGEALVAEPLSPLSRQVIEPAFARSVYERVRNRPVPPPMESRPDLILPAVREASGEMGGWPLGDSFEHASVHGNGPAGGESEPRSPKHISSPTAHPKAAPDNNVLLSVSGPST